MRIIAELTIPRAGSWNGKFSGSGDAYTIARKILKRDTQLADIYSRIAKNEIIDYSYDFGDGWVARITLRKPRQREKPTNIFLGYEWMVDSIFKNRRIIEPRDKEEEN